MYNFIIKIIRTFSIIVALLLNLSPYWNFVSFRCIIFKTCAQFFCIEFIKRRVAKSHQEQLDISIHHKPIKRHIPVVLSWCHKERTVQFLQDTFFQKRSISISFALHKIKNYLVALFPKSQEAFSPVDSTNFVFAKKPFSECLRKQNELAPQS